MEDRCRNRSAQRLVANDLDRAVCPDPSALSPKPLPRLRRGPPQVPNACPTQRAKRLAHRCRKRQDACPQRYVIRIVSTGLSPDGTTREECGTSAAWVCARGGAGQAALRQSTGAKLRRILRLSVLTRVSTGPYNPPHNGAPSAIGAMTRPRSSSPQVCQSSGLGRVSWASAALRFTGEGDRHGLRAV